MNITCDQRGCSAVAWLKGSKHHFYEDRYRLLPRSVPLVKQAERGELFAVFDGIGSAPEGMRAAQHMCDILTKFYTEAESHSCSVEGLHDLLQNGNNEIFKWGFMPGTNRPLGGCAGTVAWIFNDKLYIFHAGDTLALHISSTEAVQLTHLHEINGAIYRYFGFGPNLEIDINQYAINSSDRILLLSDGVTKAFHPLAAADIVDEHVKLNRAVSELVRLSRIKGSSDDITAVLIEIE